MYLKHTHVHACTHMHTHTQRSLSTSVALIRLMRPFTRLTEEVALNHKIYQNSLIGLQELSDTKSRHKFSLLASGCND